MDNNYNSLKLENQLCFPLYVCSKEIIRRYTPFLEPLGLTYTQYIAMIVLWEEGEINVKEMGRKLFLDSGTLTPLLKKLETKGYIKREPSKNDGRSLIISITDEGEALKERAVNIPEMVCGCINLPPEKSAALNEILNELLGCI